MASTQKMLEQMGKTLQSLVEDTQEEAIKHTPFCVPAPHNTDELELKNALQRMLGESYTDENTPMG